MVREMECVKKTWISLMCSANDLLKNGIAFFNETGNEESDRCNRNKNIFILHAHILGMKRMLDALDEGLWNNLDLDIPPSEAIQMPTLQVQHTCISTADNPPATSSHSDAPENNKLGKPNVKMDKLKMDKLKRRYEGLPYPPKAITYNEEDIKNEMEFFRSKFPVETEEKISFLTVTKNEETSQNSSKCQSPVNSCERRPSRLSLGPPRKPRGSKPHPFQYANDIQRNILSKPSLLAEPRKKRKILDQSIEEEREPKIANVNPKYNERKCEEFENSSKQNTHNMKIVEKSPKRIISNSAKPKHEASKKEKIANVNPKCNDEIKCNEFENSSKQNPTLKIKSEKSNSAKRKGAASKTGKNYSPDQPKSKKKNKLHLESSAEKETYLITKHFVSKKGYRKIHTRSPKK